MKIFYNAIRDELISSINSDLDERLKDRVWNCSKQSWDKNLTEGIFGTCLTGEVDFRFKAKLKTELKSILPPFEFTANFHFWQEMSGINFHCDGNYSFGATLYLNDWKKEWGGLFVWQDINSKMHIICPQAGMLVLNDEKEEHSVTPVHPSAPYARRSIQLFGA
tara:strand:- start:46 stop:537 length:492 start_codon:yes stop_codon:yes gene_type:complete